MVVFFMVHLEVMLGGALYSSENRGHVGGRSGGSKRVHGGCRQMSACGNRGLWIWAEKCYSKSL
jgi:hypothetical protein